MNHPKYILPTIVTSQFLCTSLWFASNGVMSELITNFNLDQNALGYLTSIVQLGFIIGTLVFSILSIADRYAPSKVFFICAIFGAIFNLGVIWEENTYGSILLFRFFTGFFLAGIYPVGMKIASDYYEDGLEKSLGFLVGALVIGTAFPHLLKNIKGKLPWEFVLVTTSILAILGGLLMISLVPNGPFRKMTQKINIFAIPKIFKNQNFRAAAFGYFGHMWELYSFWAFVPFILQSYLKKHPETSISISLLSFIVIGIGGLSCVLGSYAAKRYGIKRIVFITLFSSCVCCLISPFILYIDSQILFISFLLFWGMVVIADSPLFSTLIAQNAPLELKGTALTIVNSIGFFLTMISIQLMDGLKTLTNSTTILIILAIGPILSLIILIKNNYLRI